MKFRHAAALVAISIATGTATAFMLTAGTAMAPEPANLVAPLEASSGATAAAVYPSTGITTTVLWWPDTWKSGSVAAGTPCSNIRLTSGSSTTRHIQAIGSQRRCI